MTEMNPFGTISRLIATRDHVKLAKQGKYDQLIQNVTKQGIPLPTCSYKLLKSDDSTKELPFDGKSVGEIAVR